MLNLTPSEVQEPPTKDSLSDGLDFSQQMMNLSSHETKKTVDE